MRGVQFRASSRREGTPLQAGIEKQRSLGVYIGVYIRLRKNVCCCRMCWARVVHGSESTIPSLNSRTKADQSGIRQR